MKFLFRNRGRDDDSAEESEELPESVENAAASPEAESADVVVDDVAVNDIIVNEEEAALPEAAEITPLAPLIAGSFLHDRWEVLEVTRRGAVNFYAVADDEMEQPAAVQLAQQPASDACFKDSLESALWQPLDIFTQDECDYAAFATGEFRFLSDWRESPQDESYLRIVHDVVSGLREWREKGLAPAADGVWGADENRQIRYLGFLQQEVPAQQDDYEALLRDLNAQLLKRVFASSSTMRLGDAWSALPFCEETISLIRAIQEEHMTLDECAQRLEELASAKVLLCDVALQTDPGQERDLNEDSGAVLHWQSVGEQRQQQIDAWIIADGMGGHENGEVASLLAVNTLQALFLARSSEIDFAHNGQVRQALFEMVQQVNAAVYKLGVASHTRTPPGTTLVAALRVGQRLFVINVGDSRAYLWSEKDGLRRISRDHSYVQDLLDRGEITTEEVFGHPQGNIITSNIGLKRLEQCDIYLRLAQPGDKLLLVSDGVTDMLREAQIAEIIANNDAAALCQTLVDEANAAGGADNITALAVHFTAPQTPLDAGADAAVHEEESTEIQ